MEIRRYCAGSHARRGVLSFAASILYMQENEMKNEKIRKSCSGQRKTPFPVPLTGYAALLFFAGKRKKPRVCGNRVFLLFFGQHRPTPACAGNVLELEVCSALFRSHPRACGKHRVSTSVTTFVGEPPPRVREILAHLCVLFASLRSTPARAGSAQPYRDTCSSSRAHPRTCE